LFDESDGDDKSDQDEEMGYKEEAKFKKDYSGQKKSPIQTKDYSDELQMDKSLIVDKYRYGFQDSSSKKRGQNVLSLSPSDPNRRKGGNSRTNMSTMQDPKAGYSVMISGSAVNRLNDSDEVDPNKKFM
jgi:hypothetical protein